MGIEPGISGIAWSWALWGGSVWGSLKTSLYAVRICWMASGVWEVSCCLIGEGSDMWSTRTKAHMSLPLVELYTFVAEIEDI